MSPPTNKRKRTLSQSLDRPERPEKDNDGPTTRSEEIYFEDGNIVLVAEHTAFRVHRSQLTRHSDVFRDMLALPKGPGVTEEFDGCPVVRLSDPSKDVASLLRVLYGHAQYDCTDMERLSAVARLSTKYFIDHLRKSILHTLSKPYPSLLRKFDDYCEILPASGEIVKLAHEIHADVLLPAAYYRLCALGTCHALTLGLSPSALQAYLLGKETLSVRLIDFLSDEMMGDYARCNGCHCSDTWDEMKSHVARIVLQSPSVVSRPSPLEELHELTECSFLQRMCQKCRETIQGVIREERNNLWSCLPAIFELDHWDTLREGL